MVFFFLFLLVYYCLNIIYLVDIPNNFVVGIDQCVNLAI